MKHKVSELEGELLDAAVAKAMGYSSIRLVPDGLCGTWYAGESDGGVNDWFPSKSWEQAGPIIERERMNICWNDDCRDKRRQWSAYPDCIDIGGLQYGPTPLIAAMRAFVHSKFGDEVAIP